MTESFSENEMQVLYLRVIQEFKYKKLDIDKKLDEIVNKKITKIEKDCKKFKGAILYFGNGYVGEKNKHGMPDGMGSLLFHSTEDVYVGQFDSGLKHGLGKYTYLSGGGSAHHPFSIPYYTGEWFADSYHGLGKHLVTEFEDLMIYEGTHTHDKKTGNGTCERNRETPDGHRRRLLESLRLHRKIRKRHSTTKNGIPGRRTRLVATV